MAGVMFLLGLPGIVRAALQSVVNDSNSDFWEFLFDLNKKVLMNREKEFLFQLK